MRKSSISKFSDEEIVAAVIAGDSELYVNLVQRYQKALFRYALSLVSDHDVAQDIVQDAFIKAYVNLRGFNQKKKFSSWIYRITHNRAMDFFRSQKKLLSFEAIPELVSTFRSSSDVEAEFEASLTQKNIDSVIYSLPAQYRGVVTLYFIENKKYGEISEILGVPEGTVATWLRRSKQLLAKALQDHKP